MTPSPPSSKKKNKKKKKKHMQMFQAEQDFMIQALGQKLHEFTPPKPKPLSSSVSPDTKGLTSSISLGQKSPTKRVSFDLPNITSPETPDIAPGSSGKKRTRGPGRKKLGQPRLQKRTKRSK